MGIIRIGCTGPRGGMTSLQIQGVHDYLAYAQLISDSDPGVTGFEAHHGDCLGSDAAFHVIATVLRFRTVAHPPASTRLRAFCKADEIRPVKGYLDRDWDIAYETGTLLATPDCLPRAGSGTWATVSFALQAARPVVLFWPDGSTGSGIEYLDRLRAAGLLSVPA